MKSKFQSFILLLWIIAINCNDGFLTFGEWKTKSGDPIPHPLCYGAVYDELLESNMIQPDHSVLDVACG